MGSEAGEVTMNAMPHFTSLRAAVIAAFVTLILSAAPPALASAHTPEPGSKERKAICDALREYLLTHVASRKPPQPIVFKVDDLRVDKGFAWFGGIPLLKDGSYVPGDVLPDVGYMFVLQRSGTGWKVKQDLSRSDVPSSSEVSQLRSELRDVPTSIMPEFWRRLLKR